MRLPERWSVCRTAWRFRSLPPPEPGRRRPSRSTAASPPDRSGPAPRRPARRATPAPSPSPTDRRVGDAMKILGRLVGTLASVLLGFGVTPAFGAVTCNASVTSITKGYDPNVVGDTVVTGSYTISCTRLASDPNTFNWQLGANNGLQPGGGGQNRVQMGGGANRYNYELYRITPYVNGNRWQDGGGNRFNGTLNFGAGLVATQSGAFDLRLPGPQTVDPAGTYTDTVTVTVRNGSGTMLSQTTFNVSIITIANCTLTSPPGNINLS